MQHILLRQGSFTPDVVLNIEILLTLNSEETKTPGYGIWNGVEHDFYDPNAEP